FSRDWSADVCSSDLAEVPHPFRAFMLTGVVRVEMPPCGFRSCWFPLFHCGLTAAFGMNVKTMFAGWKSLEIGSKFQPFIGFGDFHRPDGLAYPLRSD